jgi:hypothetical protein
MEIKGSGSQPSNILFRRGYGGQEEVMSDEQAIRLVDGN